MILISKLNSCLKNFLKYFMQDKSNGNSLSFCLSGISPFLKDSFTGYSIFNRQFFFLVIRMCHLVLSWLTMFPPQNLLIT